MIDLHVHTKYSLLDSINEPKDIVKKALEDGKTAVCVTDHGNIMASIETYKLCKENNLKFIYGCEFYICNNVEVNDKNNRYNHLIVLAKNEQGRVNINKLVSLSTQYKYYGKPRIDWNMLIKYKEGLIVLSACLAGVISRILTGKRSQEQLLDIDIDGINRKLNKKEMAMIAAQRYKDEFGEDFYIEIQAHDVEEQKDINMQLVELAKQLDIQYVVTTDAHYLTREDQKYHSVWVQIGTTREAGEIYNDCYIMTELEVKNKLSKYLSDVEVYNAINNTEIIANKCNVEIPLRDPQLPHIEIPKRFKNENEYVKYMCAKGWIEKGIINKNKEEQIVYKDRLNYELNALDTMGFLGYFIIVRDYKSTAKKVGISRGCFTGDALIPTKNGSKELKDVDVGDYVITADGQFNRVNKTHKYNIKEDLVQFSAMYSNNKFHTNTCTLDHKIAVYNNGMLEWKEAKNLKNGDYLFSPHLDNKYKDEEDIVIDLNKYNIYDYDYDDEYIYEKKSIEKSYQYSIRDVSRKTGVYREGIKKWVFQLGNTSESNVKKILEYIPFKTREEYKEYLDSYSTTKINRYLKMDYDTNKIIGMLYGDGNTRESRVCVVGDSNSKTNNLQDFFAFSNKNGLKHSVIYPKDKNMWIFSILSPTFTEFIKEEFFSSKLGESKSFNTRYYNQNNKALKGLVDGLESSDGSVCGDSVTFSNTSESLIGAYKNIYSILGNNGLFVTERPAYIDNRGYKCKKCYAITHTKNSQSVQNIDGGMIVKISNVDFLKNKETTVYDLTIDNFSNYVLNNILVHNSAGGSLVSYLMDITDLDPIPYGLSFERFIDVGAVKLLKKGIITKKELKIPDIDLDFGGKAREEVMEYVINEHGRDNVCALGTYQYVWGKGVIRDIGKVLGIPLEETDKIAKKIDGSLDFKEVMELGIIDSYKEQYPELFQYCEKLSGLPKSFGIHSCGRVISNYPIMNLSAVDLSEEMPTLMLDMHEAEDLGMVKFDFLGVRTIDVIYDTLEMIGKTYDYIAPHNIDFEDKNVWNNFKSGNTNGVFQFSSDGMKSTLTKMGADNMETLIAANALYRPGSMAYIQNYIDRKNGEEEITYIHDDLKPILNVTYGIITYQEQLIEVGRLAGLENPDKLRKATAKKNPKLMAEVKPELKKGLLNRGWTEDTIEELWDIMVEFSKYSFNKSHSAGYSILAYQTMYLKTYHPYEFMASWINSEEGDLKKLRECYSEAKSLGLRVEKPTWRNIGGLTRVVSL